MLTSLELSGYRGFARFRLEGLKRVTLLVGENNTGKTSILEAVTILANGVSPFSLLDIMARRGERMPPAGETQIEPTFDVAHFFHGHSSEIGSRFQLQGNSSEPWGVNGAIAARQIDPNGSGRDLSSDRTAPFAEQTMSMRSNLLARTLEMRGLNGETFMAATLTSDGSLSLSAARRAGETAVSRPAVRQHFVPLEGLSNPTLARLWNQSIIESKEEDILDALRLIEPALIDLQYLSEQSEPLPRGDGFAVQRPSPASGFFVKLAGAAGRVPLGSMGDGMKRLLALSLLFGRLRSGFLLVDEIDTGLHYSMLPKMWRLVIRTAQRLNVQVIATTHSGDCVRSLALLHEEDEELANDVVLHRIERGLNESVPFTAAEMAIGARQQMEFR